MNRKSMMRKNIMMKGIKRKAMMRMDIGRKNMKKNAVYMILKVLDFHYVIVIFVSDI